MKIRQGFVSNSSSSSFLIARSRLTDEQVDMIKRHVEVAIARGWAWPTDRRARQDEEWPPCGWAHPWAVVSSEHEVRGHTSMSNFDMEEFLIRIGVDITQALFQRD